MRSTFIIVQAAIITLLAVIGAQSGQTETEQSGFTAPPAVSTTTL